MAAKEIITTISGGAKVGAAIHSKWPWLIPAVALGFLFWENEIVRNIFGFILMGQILGITSGNIKDTMGQIVDEIDKIKIDDDDIIEETKKK